MSNIDTSPTQGNPTAGPATEAPTAPSIAAGTGVGAVHLDVTDADRSSRFYTDVMGLTPLGVAGDTRILGTADRELVVLHPGADQPVLEGTTGLYHLAVVVPDRRELARVIARLGQLRYPQSPTDHTMTKSDYFWDPDGNGIEVYTESPEDGTFVYSEDTFGAVDNQGNPRSGRDPIDLEEMFSHLRPDDDLGAPIPEGSKMGHVHLHVRGIPEALGFYPDLIGLMRRFGAAFISAGGYHHHLGLNTWAGQGAPPRPTGAAGLRHYTIEVPTAADLDAVAGRLDNGGVAVESDPAGGFWVTDPSRNRVRVQVRQD
jgi:catechol 2,3-dioxygenase